MEAALTAAQKERCMHAKGLLIAERDHGKESRLQAEAFLTAEHGHIAGFRQGFRICVREKKSCGSNVRIKKPSVTVRASKLFLKLWSLLWPR